MSSPQGATTRTDSKQSGDVKGLFRFASLAEGGDAGCFYDLQNDDILWARVTDYSPEFQSMINDLTTGNVLEISFNNPEDMDSYYTIEEFDVVDETVSVYYPVNAEHPAPVDDLYDELKQTDRPTISSSPGGGDYGLEVQVQDKQILVEGESMDIFQGLVRGELLLEPYFSGEGCQQIESARGVIVVYPEDRPYIVYYLHEEVDETFNEYWTRFHQAIQDT